jgi:CheY-like chemotaxis protein
VRHYVVRQLRRLGYSVTYVSDGPAALDRLRSAAAIDLLFLDVIMPGGLNGFEVAVAARQLRPGLPVVMASGYPDAALSRHGDAPPGVDLLRKPYQVSELAQALRSALESAPLPNSDHAGTA